jgi:hypothetical protein
MSTEKREFSGSLRVGEIAMRGTADSGLEHFQA